MIFYTKTNKNGMKHITEFLNTKVKIDKDTLYRGFPKTFTIDAIIEFLEDKGFKSCLYHPNFDEYGVKQFNDILKESDTPMYMLPYHLYEMKKIIHATYLWIRIANKGEISSDNKCFYIRIPKHENLENVPGDNAIGYVETHPNSTLVDKIYKFEEQDKFIDDINKYFGWD